MALIDSAFALTIVGKPNLHPAQESTDVLLADCEVKRTRASGPGGQHRNKVETAIVITHQPTGVRSEASERRSQDLNRRQAVMRLRVNLALEVRSAPPPQPSVTWRSRVVDGKMRVNADHEDFPGLLAELLDWLCLNDYSAAEAAAHFGVTTSQLVKFLKTEPRAIQQVNHQRALRDQHKLR